MRKYLLSMFFLFLGLAVACQGNSASQYKEFYSTETPALSGSAPTPRNATPEPTVEYVISGIPHCPGLEKVAAFKFTWPDIETALDKLQDYNWGYYRCSLSQPELAALYKNDMPKPPYLWRQVVWVDHGDSSGAMFYQSIQIVWIYVWMLPHPDKNMSYLVIAHGDPGVPETWECWNRTHHGAIRC